MTEYSISKDKVRFIRYDKDAAELDYNIYDNPHEQLNKLGISVLITVPFEGCWMMLTDYQGELPEYIEEFKLEPHDKFWVDRAVEIKE